MPKIRPNFCILEGTFLFIIDLMTRTRIDCMQIMADEGPIGASAAKAAVRKTEPRRSKKLPIKPYNHRVQSKSSGVYMNWITP